ncbi:hypothetical protein LCGC14_0246000 [marine sediment metagenome]|uniref:Uncharacterized protein n=1 Tax=marine sediment metagenome TaxID=412755 RepID=A0A0F9UAM3_9ZZZZ
MSDILVKDGTTILIKEDKLLVEVTIDLEGIKTATYALKSREHNREDTEPIQSTYVQFHEGE